jgi:hypothetical protein
LKNRFSRHVSNGAAGKAWWAHQGSNLGPDD